MQLPMSVSMLRTVLAVFLLLLSIPALAMYKCTSNGKTTYSDTPCPNGKKIELDNKVTVAESDSTRARQQAAKDKARLARLEKVRHQQEAIEAKQAQAAARKAAASQRQCAKLAQRKKWTDEDAAHASGKAADKARRRARRAAESYELQCGK